MVSCKKKLNGILYFVVFPGSPKLDGGPQISLVQLYALIRSVSECSGLGLHLLRVMARLRAKKIYIYSETLYFTFSFFVSVHLTFILFGVVLTYLFLFLESQCKINISRGYVSLSGRGADSSQISQCARTRVPDHPCGRVR